MSCADEKDAKSFVARKERNVCKGNLSRLSLPRNRLASSAAGGAAPVSPCFSIKPAAGGQFAQQIEEVPIKRGHPNGCPLFIVRRLPFGYFCAAPHFLVR